MRAENEGSFLPNKCSTDSMGFTDETSAEVLAVKHLANRKLHSSTLGVYEKMPVFVPVDIAEDVVELVARKLSGSAGPGGTDSEAYKGGY